jgi:hypothetical protein
MKQNCPNTRSLDQARNLGPFVPQALSIAAHLSRRVVVSCSICIIPIWRLSSYAQPSHRLSTGFLFIVRLVVDGRLAELLRGLVPALVIRVELRPRSRSRRGHEFRHGVLPRGSRRSICTPFGRSARSFAL